MPRLPRTALALAILALSALPAAAAPALPGQVSFQGRLTHASGNPVDGDVSMTFSVYSAASGGTALWFETQTIHVSGGLYSVQLGSQTSLDGLTLDMAADRWLGVKVGEDAEMAPRYPLTGALYARRSAVAERALTADAVSDADTLDGFHAVAFAPVAHGHDASTLTGILPVANGGTGLSSAVAAGRFLRASSASAWEPSVILSTDIPAGSSNYIQNRSDVTQSASFNISGEGIFGADLTVDGNATIGSSAKATLRINAGPVNFPNAITTAEALVLGGDATLYRSAASTLMTDNSLEVGKSLTVGSDATIGAALTVNGNTTLGKANTATLTVNAGAVTFPNATTSTYALILGGDATLYRSAASTLMTDNFLEVGRSLTVGSNATIGVALTVNGNTTLGNANTDTLTVNAGAAAFPNATTATNALILGGDTNLYRSAANTLYTDDSLTVSGGLVVNDALSANGNTYLGNASTDNVQVAAGKIFLQNITTSTNAMIIGGDTKVYRPSSATLQIENNLIVNTNLDVGGALTVGTNNIKMPSAYATIAADGTVSSGSPNVACVRIYVDNPFPAGDDYYYLVTIAGVAFSTATHVAVVTPNSAGCGSCVWNYAGGIMGVRFQNFDYEPVPAPFSFIVYRP